MRTILEEYGSFIIEFVMGVIITAVLFVALNGMSMFGNQAASVEVGNQVPPEYTEINHIEFNGKQYINPNYKFVSNKAKVYLNCEMTDKANNQYLFGAKSTTSPKFASTIYTADNGNITYACGDSDRVATFSINKRVSFIADITDATNISLSNGTESRQVAYKNGINKTLNVMIGAVNNNGNVTNHAKMKLFSCQIYQDGGIIRDLVPVLRTKDKKPGLYDRVNNVFYTNMGTGEFGYDKFL